MDSFVQRFRDSSELVLNNLRIDDVAYAPARLPCFDLSSMEQTSAKLGFVAPLHTFCILSAYFIKNIYDIFQVVLKLS